MKKTRELAERLIGRLLENEADEIGDEDLEAAADFYDTHVDKSLSFDEVVEKANEILAAHEEGARMDHGFDAGEWSGPAHDEMAMGKIRELCARHDVDFDDVMTRINYGDDPMGEWHGRNE